MPGPSVHGRVDIDGRHLVVNHQMPPVASTDPLALMARTCQKYLVRTFRFDVAASTLPTLVHVEHTELVVKHT